MAVSSAINTIRWIILVPGAVIGGTLLGIVVSLLPRMTFNEFIGNLIASAFIGSSIAYMAHTIAPAHKRRVALVFAFGLTALLLMAAGAVTLMALIRTGIDGGFWAYLIYTAITIGSLLVTANSMEDD